MASKACVSDGNDQLADVIPIGVKFVTECSTRWGSDFEQFELSKEEGSTRCCSDFELFEFQRAH